MPDAARFAALAAGQAVAVAHVAVMNLMFLHTQSELLWSPLTKMRRKKWDEKKVIGSETGFRMIFVNLFLKTKK